MAKLRDEMPREALDYEGDRFQRYLDLEVVQEFFGETRKPWPGVQRNVNCWWLLENGMAVGWNEGPKGWFFPVLSKNVVKKAGIIISKY